MSKWTETVIFMIVCTMFLAAAAWTIHKAAERSKARVYGTTARP